MNEEKRLIKNIIKGVTIIFYCLTILIIAKIGFGHQIKIEIAEDILIIFCTISFYLLQRKMKKKRKK